MIRKNGAPISSRGLPPAGFFVTKSEYRAYLQTAHWAFLKLRLYARRGRRCMACGSKKRIDAHHIRYREPITDCTEDDLMPLCRACHDCVHRTPGFVQESDGIDSNDGRRLHAIISIRVLRPEVVPVVEGAIPEIIRPQKIPRRRKRFSEYRDYIAAAESGSFEALRRPRFRTTGKIHCGNPKYHVSPEGKVTRLIPPRCVKKLDKFVKSPQPSKP